MKSNYKPIGQLIEKVDERNTDGSVSTLVGLSIDKCFIKSVANIIGTDLTKYKIIRKKYFAVSLMQVSRDEKIPIAMQTDYEVAIMSPAYPIFKVSDENIILPEYLDMWFKRAEFDREATFIAVGGVRGSMPWEDFCRMEVYVPPLEKQMKIVKAYKTITDRIALKQRINDNLEATLSAVFSSLFVVDTQGEFAYLGDFITFGNGKARPKTIGKIPVYGGNGVLSYTESSNASNVVLIGRVGAYCGSVYLETSDCWVSDNAIYAKSKISDKEYFDYFLLKRLNLYNHHVGTGQQLLTQEILNKIAVNWFDLVDIAKFNEYSEKLYSTILHNKTEIDELQKVSEILLSNLSERRI